MRLAWIIVAMLGCASPKHEVKPTWAISEPGAAPQSLMRYAVGSSSAYVNLRFDGESSAGSVDWWGRLQKAENHLPSLGVIARIGSERVGTKVIRTVRIESVEVSGASLATLPVTVAMLSTIGLTGQWTVSDRGEIERFDLVVPKGKEGDLSGAVLFRLVFEHYFVALPDKPLGANALWTEESGGMLQNLTWDKKASYRAAFPDGAIAIDGSFHTLAQPAELWVSPKGDMKLMYGILSTKLEEVASLESVQIEGQAEHTFEASFEMRNGRLKASLLLMFKGTSRLRVLRPHFTSMRRNQPAKL
ncbi:MAG TPA: hypothetical protein VGM90_00330 [Kofleriaceae bacterium]|jgi:hypothetical protein